MNPSRLKALRTARGFTLDDLSEAMGRLVTKQALSKYEHGASVPTPRVLVALAKALGVKAIDLAAEPAASVSILAFRKRSTFSKSAQQALENQVALALERRAELQELVGQRCTGDVPLQAYPVNSLDDIEVAADTLRDHWELGRDSLDQMVDVLEEHCFHVLGVDAPEQFDGMSAVAEVGGEPVAVAVVSRSGVCRERQRLSLGHELGHLVMAVSDAVDEEKAAYRFGSAFLAPRETLLREVGTRRTDISSEELFILKRKFGVSLAALVYRLHDLDVISDRYYQEWWRHINKMGWRKEEPQETPPEQPRWLAQSTLRAFSEGLITEAYAESLLGHTMPVSGGPSRRRALAALPRKKRAAVLAKQAAVAADHYAAGSSGGGDEGDDLDDEVVDY
jgi:transcriptional regulator with XRE-family HTH domain